MDFADPHHRHIFFELHSGLPREGPGSHDCTARALTMAGPLPPQLQIIDVACRPGMQTMDRAVLVSEARIVAVDIHAPFLQELQRRAKAAGVAHRIEALRADMAALPFAPGSFDLSWCEGAAYIMGVGKALRAWQPLLRPGGKLALTEAVWLKPNPPQSVRRCWAQYPDMRDMAFNRKLVRDCGYELLGDFVLPPNAWWDDYYGPKQKRLAALLRKYAGDSSATAVLTESRDEMELHKHYSDYYGYVFLVMQSR